MLRVDPATGRRSQADPGSARAGDAGLVVRAPQVVVAAGALRTPAILRPRASTHPAIGRNLRLHPVPVVAGIFDEPIDMWRGTMQAARSLQFAAADARAPNGYAIESAPGHPGLIALALPWEGTDAPRCGCSDGSAPLRRSSRSPATAARAGSA